MPQNRYPRLFQAAQSVGGQKRLVEAIGAIEAGVAQSRIRNVDYQNAKHTLGLAVERAWDALLDTHQEAYQTISVGANITILSLHDVLSAQKKVAKIVQRSAAVEAAQALLDEALPLAQQAKGLKDKVVKGRVARETPAQPANPNKVVGTCPCCFRGIAVKGTMVHHGYRRPGHGFQTSSCPGIQFKPLEESLAGLKWMIGLAEESVQYAKQCVDASPHVQEIVLRLRNAVARVVKPSDADWPREHRAYIGRMEQAYQEQCSALAFYQEKLIQWQTYHEEQSCIEPPATPVRPRG